MTPPNNTVAGLAERPKLTMKLSELPGWIERVIQDIENPVFNYSPAAIANALRQMLRTLAETQQDDAALASPAPSAGVGVEDTRVEFERWVSKRHGCGTERWADTGKYRYDNTNAWWECWTAALSGVSAPVVDESFDAEDNAHFIEHCADKLERVGYQVSAGALRVIAAEYRALSGVSAPVGAEALSLFLVATEAVRILRLSGYHTIADSLEKVSWPQHPAAPRVEGYTPASADSFDSHHNTATPSEDGLLRRFEQYQHDERHHTVEETRYWCEQYRNLARDTIRRLASGQVPETKLRNALEEIATVAHSDQSESDLPTVLAWLASVVDPLLAAAPSGVRVDDAMVERAMAALASKWGWTPTHDGTRDDVRTVLTAALSANEVSRG